jgi:hypothetical protein
MIKIFHNDHALCLAITGVKAQPVYGSCSKKCAFAAGRR